MPIPVEFSFSSESDFVERFLIPLLQRLGFMVVIHYHGTREFGKDLIFAEVDRFGDVRYYGLQAKYVDTIGMGRAVEDLVSDCKQAFEVPFRNPQNGLEQRIGTFYGVNGGSISDQARQYYFEALSKPYGPNVRLLDGKALLTLDRGAAFNRVESVGEHLTGLLLEIRYNRRIAPSVVVPLQQMLSGGGYLPMERFRAQAAANYLLRPLLPRAMSMDEVEHYWYLTSGVNNALDFVSAPMRDRSQEIPKVIAFIGEVEPIGRELESTILSILGDLGPLAAR